MRSSTKTRRFSLAPPNQGVPALWDFCNARQIFFSSHIADRFSCSAVTKLQQTEAGGMISHFINEPDHWRARAEEARNLANQMNDPESKDALSNPTAPNSLPFAKLKAPAAFAP